MSAATFERRQSPSILLWLVLAGLIALAAVASQVTASSHAVARHDAALAEHARLCNQENRVNQVWASSRRGTFAEICEMNNANAWESDKTWTIRIIDKSTGNEITVFGHTGDIASLEEYMIRQLYVFLQ